MPRRNRLTLTILALVLVAASLLPARSVAQPTSKLYVGHYARLTTQIPSDWSVDPTGLYDYVGTDGFVVSFPVMVQTLDEACATLAASPRFDVPATVGDATWSSLKACRVTGRLEEDDVIALVVPHPYPFELYGERFAYAALIADSDELDSVVATLSFSPDRVTPEAYLMSVMDILEARAYWSDEVDWPLARQQALASIDGLPTVEMAQGALLATVGRLRTAGDNHSFVRLADQSNPLAESSGFGMLVGGQQVLAVHPDGPADRAGVHAGDVIEAVNGRPFRPTPRPIDPVALGGIDPSNRWGLAAQLTLRRPLEQDAITVTVEQGTYSRYLPPSGHRLPGDIGYISIPNFSTPGQQIAFAATANRIIAEVDASPTCGWVVDLRLNGGGSYSPMITGVGPILSNGTFLGWRWPDGRQTWVAYEDGRIADDGKEVSDYLGERMYALQRPGPPIAVLTGPSTASSGEVTTLAFVERSKARLFGEPTSGRTTGNVTYFLFDGTGIALAVAAMTDRTGATHMAGVEPDEYVSIDWTAYGTEDDPVLNAALDWLNQQPDCANPQVET